MTRRRTYPRWMIRALILFALGMTIFASVASREHHSVENARNAALSQLVAANAAKLQSSNPSLAMQLALVSWGMSHSMQARSTLLDMAAGELPTRLLGHNGHSALALGDDGHRVAIGYQRGGTVKLYSLRFAQLTLLASVPGAARGARLDTIAISHSGRLLAVGTSDGRVALWSLSSTTHPRQLASLRAGSGAIRGLSFSPGGAALAAADADGGVQRWSLRDPTHPALAPRLVAPGRVPLQAVSYSHDGSTLAAVGRHGTLVVWHAHAGSRPLATLGGGTTTLTAVTYSPDGHTLAVGGKDGSTQLWKLAADGAPQQQDGSLHGHGGVAALAFSRDGRYLAVGAASRAVRIWTSSGSRQVASLAQPGAVTGVAFTDGDRRLISSDVAGTTMLWQMPPPSTYEFDSPVTGLSYSTTQPRLEVSTQAGRTDGWNIVDEWRPAPVGSWYATPSSESPVDAYWIKAATATTPTATTPSGLPVNPHAGDLALRQTKASTRVLSSALSPNGVLFAAAGSDHLVWLWDVTVPSQPKLVEKLSGFRRWVTSVAFSGNGQTLFAGSDDHTLRMWNLVNPERPEELANSPLVGPRSAITKIAVSPDGHTLAAATAEGHVWLWYVSTPTKAGLGAMLAAAHGRLTALAFSPSDNTLVTGGSRRRLTFWHYRPYQVVNRMCALEGTPITPYEWEQYVPGAAYKPPCAKWTPPPPPVPAVPASH